MALSDMIDKGGSWVPPRLVLYGDEKVGKTSTAAQAPKPLYIGTDDGRRRLQVDGLPIPSTWEEFVAQLTQVTKEAPSLGYESVITDTLNGVIELCAQHVCDTQFGGRWNDPKHGFLAWGGTQGWSAVSEAVRSILPLYDRLIDAGVWVVLLAHSTAARVRNPLTGDYDRFQPAIDKRVWGRIAQWADVILRVDFDTAFKTDETSGRRLAVSDGTRILRCSASAAEAAGCRVGYELPDVLPFAWESIETHLGQQSEDTINTLTELWSLMTDDEETKAEAFLGVGKDNLAAAQLHQVRALINRLEAKKEAASGTSS